MAWYDSFQQEGYVPAGMTPKRVVTGGGEPGYYPSDSLNVGIRAAQKFMLEQQQDFEKQQKKLRDQADLYKTLRDSGYDPAKAYEAVKKQQLPDVPGGKSLDEQKKEAEINKENALGDYYRQRATLGEKEREKILKKIADGEILSEGEQEIYDNVIKKGTGSQDALSQALKEKQIEKTGAQTTKINAQTKQIESKQATITERIKAKVAGGEALTPGEQKVYDDVIKKSGVGSGDLEGALSGKKDKYAGKVPVWTQDGRPAWVDADKLDKAIKRGFRKRQAAKNE